MTKASSSCWKFDSFPPGAKEETEWHYYRATNSAEGGGQDGLTKCWTLTQETAVCFPFLYNSKCWCNPCGCPLTIIKLLSLKLWWRMTPNLSKWYFQSKPPCFPNLDQDIFVPKPNQSTTIVLSDHETVLFFKQQYLCVVLQGIFSCLIWRTCCDGPIGTDAFRLPEG